MMFVGFASAQQTPTSKSKTSTADTINPGKTHKSTHKSSSTYNKSGTTKTNSTTSKHKTNHSTTTDTVNKRPTTGTGQGNMNGTETRQK